jgi:hypothetical protein
MDAEFILFRKGFWHAGVLGCEQMFGCMEAIRTKREALDAGTAEWLTMVGAYDRSEAWRLDGYWSAAAALADVCRRAEGVGGGRAVRDRRA